VALLESQAALLILSCHEHEHDALCMLSTLTPTPGGMPGLGSLLTAAPPPFQHTSPHPSHSSASVPGHHPHPHAGPHTHGPTAEAPQLNAPNLMGAGIHPAAPLLLDSPTTQPHLHFPLVSVRG
jgi:hypothetical protein